MKLNIEESPQVEDAILEWLKGGGVPKEALNIEEDDEDANDGEAEPEADLTVEGQPLYVVNVTVTLRRLKPAEEEDD